MSAQKSGMRRAARIVAGLMAAALVAGCGGSGGAGGTPTSSPSPTPTPTGSETEPADDGTDDGGDAAWDAIVEAARQEGELHISVHGGEGYEEWGRQVQALFPDINIQVTSAGPSASVPRIITEQQNGQHLWDLIIGPNGNVQNALIPAGATQLITPFLDDLPEDVKRDEDWPGGFGFYNDPDDPHGLIFQINLTGQVYVNRDLAPDVQTPEDLLDPQWRGRIAVEDIRRTDGGSQYLTTLLHGYGEDYMRSLLDQDLQLLEDKEVVMDWVEEGRVAIGLSISPDVYARLQGLGLGDNVEQVTELGGTTLAYTVTPLKDAPNPNAIRYFLNYFLSQEGQDLWARVSREDAHSRRADVPDHHGFSPDYEAVADYPLILGTSSEAGLMDRLQAIIAEYF